MTSSLRTYRHSVTGLTAQYHPRVASADPHLIEVREGSKPLAYMPIPQAAIEELRSERDNGADPSGDEELTDTDESEALGASENEE